MAYRYGDRTQRMLLPQSIDEYIPDDAPVRDYDVIVDSLDLENLGISFDPPHKVSCPEYDRKVMLKLSLCLMTIEQPDRSAILAKTRYDQLSPQPSQVSLSTIHHLDSASEVSVPANKNCNYTS